MVTLTVKKILESQQIEINGNPVTKYNVLTSDDEVVETFSKLEVGQSYEGEITETKWGKKFKRQKKPFNLRSPEDQKSIIRQHSQEMALKYTELKIQTGELKKFGLLDLKPIIDWFAADAKIAEVTKDEEPKKDEAFQEDPWDANNLERFMND